MNAKYEVVERIGRDVVMVAKQGGFARRMRPCHYCGRMTSNYACSACKRKRGWSSEVCADDGIIPEGCNGK